ncbi:MAG: 4Fe-4S binding protein [Anaerolineaceae bacterium]|nr:4Fe-4S binding protein [Anaerolineaceae bacterium]
MRNSIKVEEVSAEMPETVINWLVNQNRMSWMTDWQQDLPVPMIDLERCNGCELCVHACPTGALAIADHHAVVANPGACTYTGHCELICPEQAISRFFQIMFVPRKENPMTSTYYPNWREKIQFSAEGPKPQILAENEVIKVVLAGLEDGQIIPPHPESQAVYHFLEGTGWMTVDDERHPVAAGAIVITRDGARRGVEATSRLAFLAVRIAH